ncbi:hypothetical protein Slala05_78960 [Streptomyces lavendulae subsp. lavendulae]|nr:hypothetical protein Slala05_78960 [Streptomyces lavendulae subsp. lavendulae]
MAEGGDDFVDPVAQLSTPGNGHVINGRVPLDGHRPFGEWMPRSESKDDPVPADEAVTDVGLRRRSVTEPPPT